MKKQNKSFLLLLTIMVLPLQAQIQTPYKEVLKTIENNSLKLKSLKEKQKTAQLESKTNLYLDNPEVSFGYLWGSPRQQGKRTNFGVTQALDFPTLYYQKRKQSQLEEHSATWAYRSERISLLLEVQQLCVQLTYQNANLALFTERKEEASQLVDAYEKSYKAGESTIIERNKARLYLRNITYQKAQLQAKHEQALEKLAGINGGELIHFTTNNFNLPALPNSFELWYQETEQQNPALQYLASQLKVNQRAIKVSRAEALPKFNVGYAQELVNGEGFKGVTFGFSIPLFKDKNKIKVAKMRAKSSQLIFDDAKQRFYNELKGQYAAAFSLQKEAISYRNLLLKDNSKDLLEKALKAGEISLIDYLQEIDYFYEAMQQSLRAEMEYLLAITSLYRIIL